MTRIATVSLLACAALLQGCAPLVVGGAVAGGAMVAADRRQPDIMATDERIEIQATNRISDIFKDKGNINVTCYNKEVLLTGEAPTEALKQDAEKAAATVPEVKGVINDLQIGPPSSLGQRSNDTYLTSVVKSRFVTAQKFNPIHVKVVTESGTVYLMGLVTRREADDATQIARTTNGVKRVVRVFEYVADSPPQPKPAPAAPAK
ncbi:MAG TPA: BON domain-containing protein [Burkholderiales bacterium]|nr:BON domain-containing protein [Burkholderiales bacterium]